MAKQLNTGAVLLLSNIFIILTTVLVLGAALYRYQGKIQNITLSENRFLTTEWHLLQELKAQTDSLLQEKDLEIARLRSQYRSFSKEELSGERLKKIEEELRIAEAERAAILSARLSVMASGSDKNTDLSSPRELVEAAAKSAMPEAENALLPAADDQNATRDTTETAPLLNELLAERIQSLEAQNSALRIRAEQAEARLEQSNQLQDTQGHTAAASGTTGTSTAEAKLVLALYHILEEELALVDSETKPDLASIRTRALLRALVSSPAIRAEYPDLLQAMDESFEDFGKQEWLRGQKDAYLFIQKSLQTLENVEEQEGT